MPIIKKFWLKPHKMLPFTWSKYGTPVWKISGENRYFTQTPRGKYVLIRKPKQRFL